MNRVALLLSTTVVISGCGASGTSPNPPAPPPPPPAAVSSIAVVLSAGSALVGQTVQATASVKDAAGNTLAGRTVTWASSAADIATVSSAGLVTAVGMGTTQITATSDGVNGSQPLIVLPSAEQVDSVVLNVDSVEVTVGDTARLTATARGASGKPLPGIQVAWSSSDTTVARVTADGLVSVVDWGEATIDATVTGPVPSGPAGAPAAVAKGRGSRSRSKIIGVPKISISPATKTANAGDQVFYSAVVSDAAGNPLARQPGIGWASSNLAVATIDKAGMATAVGKGTATIVATAQVGPNYKYSTPAPKSASLTVDVCDGLLDVASWDAAVSSSFSVPTVTPAASNGLSYTIEQSSSGSASLGLDLAGPTMSVWSGPVAGTAKIDNMITATDPQGGTRIDEHEAGSGSQAGKQRVQLTIEWIRSSNICQATIGYQDQLKYVDSSKVADLVFQEDRPLGLAMDIQRPIGSKPSSGWVLSQTVDLQAIVSPIVDDSRWPSSPVKGLSQVYFPGSNIGIDLAAAVGFLQAFGTGKFTYRLTAP